MTSAGSPAFNGLKTFNPIWGANWPIAGFFLYNSETIQPIFTKFCDFNDTYTGCLNEIAKSFKAIVPKKPGSRVP